MVKNPSGAFRGFMNWGLASPETYIPCFSIFTVLELRQKPSVYTAFLDFFSVFPCVVVKSLDQLVAEETAAYWSRQTISPILLGFAGPAVPPERRLQAALDTFFATPGGQRDEARWLSERQAVVDGIVGLAREYQQDSSQTSAERLSNWLHFTVFQQLVYRSGVFAQSLVDKEELLDVDRLPSLKMLAYNVYFKYYVDDRVPSSSDAFDLLIASSAPYADAFATERHQAEVIRKIKHRDPFLDGLVVLTLQDLRSAAQSTPGA